jgi:hypothetical protein
MSDPVYDPNFEFNAPKVLEISMLTHCGHPQALPCCFSSCFVGEVASLDGMCLDFRH